MAVVRPVHTRGAFSMVIPQPDNTPDAFVRSDVIAIRRMRDDMRDFELMSQWLSDERVLEFYEGRDNPHDTSKVIAKFGPRAQGKDRVVPCIMVYRDRPIGYIQYYQVSASERQECGIESIGGVWGVDLFIGEPALWGRGIGTHALTALLGYLFDTLNATRVIIDPHVSNVRAIRSYEKCGFRKVKLLPRHELHEGEYRYAWLMEVPRAK